MGRLIIVVIVFGVIGYLCYLAYTNTVFYKLKKLNKDNAYKHLYVDIVRLYRPFELSSHIGKIYRIENIDGEISKKEIYNTDYKTNKRKVFDEIETVIENF